MQMPSWYETQRSALAASSVLGLQAQREAAHALCAASGLPANNSSFWCYTNLHQWLHDDPKVSDADVAVTMPELLGAQVINQQSMTCADVLLSDGVTCHDLSYDADAWQAVSALYDLSMQDGMSAMNWALSGSVYWLRIPPNTKVTLPIAWMHHVVGKPSKASTQIRLFIEVGAGSQLSFYESLHGPAHGHWYQLHVQWHLRQDANVRLYQQQFLAGGCCAVQHQVKQETGSRFDAAVLQMGASHARCVLDHTLMGEQAQSNVLGLSQCCGQQRHDFVIRATHQGKATRSAVQHRAMVDDRSESAFNAKVLVQDTAPGSHAHQSNQNIVLSDTARAHAKPALEIYHDDVVCSHGATVGALSDEAMFFLRSRGIAEKHARDMLVAAFCQSIVDQLWDADAKNLWQQLLLHSTRGAHEAEVCGAV